MSTSDSRWNRILDALKTKPGSSGYKLEQLMSMIKRGKTASSERLEPSAVMLRRAELLYRLEPLIFSGVNKISRRITGAKAYFSGGEQVENDATQKFLESSGALSLLPHLVKDAFIYGYGVAEITREKGKIRLTQIDPKDFDYLREGSQVKLDKDGNIVGYV
jgi:hypothetical protein